jgi:hydrogenase nickel incorporation protein HypB
MQRVELAQKVLSDNARVAAMLRQRYREHGVLCLNLISAPGSGKTSLLERTLQLSPKHDHTVVLTGDIQTENDAARLRRFGFPVKQITTGGTCHLDAGMIERHIVDWPLEKIDLMFVENVGNLVCPASYDLGEEAKVVVLSVTEGDDKPLKYPSVFFQSELMVVNKTDLLPYVSFNIEAAIENARCVHPQIEVIQMSCTTGEGLDAWLSWIQKKRAMVRVAAAEPIASA